MTQDARRAATRDKLYRAAADLIAERGFAATTVDEIAERAGVAKGTVFYNFRSKTALFEQLLRHGVAALIAELRNAAAGKPPREAIDAMIATQLEYHRRDRAFAQVLLSEVWRTNAEWQQTVRQLRAEIVGTIAEVIQAGRESGQFDPVVGVDIAASALFGVGLVVAVDWLVFQPDRPIDEVRATLQAIVSTRLRPAAPSAAG